MQHVVGPSGAPDWLRVDASSNLKVAQQGLQYPSPVGQTTIQKTIASFDGYETIHTVTADKVFYLTGLSLMITSHGTASEHQLEIAGTIFLEIHGEFGQSGNTEHWDHMTFSPSVPMPFPAGTVFRVKSGNATTLVRGSIMGWEEDA